LAIVLLAIVPGFLATATWSRARTWKGPSGDLRTVLQSIAASAALQVVISPLTLWLLYPVRAELMDHPRRIAVWAFVAVLVAPFAGGIAAARIGDLLFPPKGRPWARRPSGWRRLVDGLVSAVPPPSSWDALFLTDPPSGKFVGVQFTDGTQVGGVFSQGSVAHTSPDRHGLYLAEEWILDKDGNFIEKVANSQGILICRIEDVRWVRVQAGTDPNVQP
jgi:hypothetical protein